MTSISGRVVFRELHIVVDLTFSSRMACRACGKATRGGSMFFTVMGLSRGAHITTQVIGDGVRDPANGSVCSSSEFMDGSSCDDVDVDLEDWLVVSVCMRTSPGLSSHG